MNENEILEQALKLFQSQKYAEAIPFYQKAIEIRKKYQQWEALALEMSELGTCYYYNQQYQEFFQNKIDSIMLFIQLYSKKQEDKYLTHIMENFRFLGTIAYQTQAIDIFNQLFNKIQEEFQKLNDEFGLLLTYRNAIPTYYRFQRKDLFLEITQRAMDLGEKLVKNPNIELKTLMELEGVYNMRGLWFKRRGAMDTAYKLYKRCLKAIERAAEIKGGVFDSKLAESFVYAELNFGALMKDIGKEKEGIEHIEKAYKMAKENNFWAPLQDILSQLGGHAGDIGDFKKMAEYYEEAFEITKKRKDEENYALAYNNLARSYEDYHKDLDKAKEYYEEALKWAKKFNDNYGIGKITANLAKIKEKRGDFEDAIEMYLKAIETTQPLGSKKEFKASSIICPNPECEHQIPIDIVGGQAMMMQTCSKCNSRMSLHINAEDNIYTAQIIGTEEFDKGELKIRRKERGIQGYEFSTSALKYIEDITNAYYKKFKNKSHDISDLMSSIDYALQSISLRQVLGENLGRNYYKTLINLINRTIRLINPLREIDPGKAKFYMDEIRAIAHGQDITESKLNLEGFEVSCPSCRFTNTTEVDKNLAAMVECKDCGSQFSVVYDEDSKEFFTNLIKENIKSISECIRCGAEIKKGSRFCGNCGFNFIKKMCPRCFSENKKDALECELCGTSFRISTKKSGICSNCETKNDKDAIFCTNCGQKFSIIHCKKCEAENTLFYRYCKNCGSELGKWVTFLTQKYQVGTKYIGGVGYDDITVDANIENGFDGKTNVEENWEIQTEIKETFEPKAQEDTSSEYEKKAKPSEIKETDAISKDIQLNDKEQEFLDHIRSLGHKIDKFQAKALYDLQKEAGLINTYTSTGIYITIVKVNRKELTSLPESFKFLDHISELDLSNSNLKEIPEYFTSFNNLKSLKLSGNPIESLTPVLKSLKNAGVKIDIYNDLDSVGNELKVPSAEESIEETIEDRNINIELLTEVQFPGFTNQIRIIDDNKKCIVSGAGGVVKVFNLNSEKITKSIKFSSSPYSHSKTLIFLKQKEKYLFADDLGAFLFVNAYNFEELENYFPDLKIGKNSCKSPDENYIYSVKENNLYINDLNSKKMVKRNFQNLKKLNAIAVAPIDNIIALGTKSGKIALIDSNTYEVINEINTGCKNLTDLKWSPDGQWISLGSNTPNAYILNVKSLKEEKRIKFELKRDDYKSDNYVQAIEWSPDSYWLFVSDWNGVLKVLRAADKSFAIDFERKFDAHGNEFRCLSISEDGTLLAAGLMDKFWILKVDYQEEQSEAEQKSAGLDESIPSRTKEESIKYYKELGLNKNQAKCLADIEAITGSLPLIQEVSNDSFGLKIENGAVVGLGLANKNLDILIPEIGELKELKKLTLRGNEISFWTDTLKNLENLVMLDLGDNILGRFLPFMKNFKKLIDLNLPNCDIEEIPDWIANFKKLKYLNLKDNYISSVPKSMKKMKNLALINLQENNLTEIPKYLKKLKKDTEIKI